MVWKDGHDEKSPIVRPGPRSGGFAEEDDTFAVCRPHLFPQCEMSLSVKSSEYSSPKSQRITGFRSISVFSSGCGLKAIAILPEMN